MSQYRFRFSKNVDVPAESEEAAREMLGEACDEQGSIVLNDEYAKGSFEFLGESEVVDIDEESESIGKNLAHSRGGLLLMSCQYRGENFVALCKKKNINKKQVEVTPLAIILTNEKLQFVTDLNGDHPIIRGEKNE